MDRDEAKRLASNEPTLRDTLAALAPECDEAIAHAETLLKRRDEIEGQLAQIEAAKAFLVANPIQPTTPPVEIAPQSPEPAPNEPVPASGSESSPGLPEVPTESPTAVVVVDSPLESQPPSEPATAPTNDVPSSDTDTPPEPATAPAESAGET
jgi:hypothetical protein